MTTEQQTADQQTTEPTEPVDVFKEISEAVGKNYSDKDALVKALTEKDNFIEQLKNENKTTRDLVDTLATKVDESINAQKVLEELKNQPEKTDGQPRQTTNPDEIANIFEELYTNRSKQEQARANQAIVNKKLSELYGDKASEMFKSKAAELNLSLDKVKEIASESPQAALSLLGIQSSAPKVTNVTPPSGGVANVPTGQKTPYQAFKEEMKAKGLNPTHPTYINEMNKRNLFNN